MNPAVAITTLVSLTLISLQSLPAYPTSSKESLSYNNAAALTEWAVDTSISQSEASLPDEPYNSLGAEFNLLREWHKKPRHKTHTHPGDSRPQHQSAEGNPQRQLHTRVVRSATLEEPAVSSSTLSDKDDESSPVPAATPVITVEDVSTLTEVQLKVSWFLRQLDACAIADTDEDTGDSGSDPSEGGGAQGNEDPCITAVKVTALWWEVSIQRPGNVTEYTAPRLDMETRSTTLTGLGDVEEELFVCVTAQLDIASESKTVSTIVTPATTVSQNNNNVTKSELNIILANYNRTSVAVPMNWTYTISSTLSPSFSKVRSCVTWRQTSLRVYVGVLAAVVMLSPAVVAMIYIMYRDKQAWTTYSQIDDHSYVTGVPSNDVTYQKQKEQQSPEQHQEEEQNQLQQKQFTGDNKCPGSYVNAGLCLSFEEDNIHHPAAGTITQLRESSDSRKDDGSSIANHDKEHKEHDTVVKPGVSHNTQSTRL